MRGATYYEVFYNRETDISIHAPHAGSDRRPERFPAWRSHFNPRSPCGERLRQIESRPIHVDFNPRSPCGERQPGGQGNQRALRFQSTLPMRGATLTYQLSWFRLTFQSTLPMRGATFGTVAAIDAIKFQSTLPMRGATHIVLKSGQWSGNFNPRSPCGERLCSLPP